ncbi:uncharacterized protein LOC115413216 [Xyrichtys novacula]|uniref:Uncharacterized protein LOC115413216 n=1 Tax=Xyrichtys novacula TaxID=13765 RepID=A0AAV1GNN4_XYRNO|nr:uncharacterized protein LOC115413216 [Xyrichtys novacula]
MERPSPPLTSLSESGSYSQDYKYRVAAQRRFISNERESPALKETLGQSVGVCEWVKTACYQYNELRPLLMLAVHIKTCKGKLSDDDDNNDDESSDGICVVESKCKEDVADLESCVLISRSLMMYADEIISCRYTSQIKLDSKVSIIRAIVLHSTTRVIPMLQQLRKGMELYGLVNQMASNPAACHSLFVPGKITKPDADFMMMNCQPYYSEKGTSKERAEKKVINFLQDFLKELEMAGMMYCIAVIFNLCTLVCCERLSGVPWKIIQFANNMPLSSVCTVIK